MRNYNEKIVLENFENIEISGKNFKINNEKNILENIETGEQYYTWEKANELFDLPTMLEFRVKTKEDFGEPVGYILREWQYLGDGIEMENQEIDYNKPPKYTFYLEGKASFYWSKDEKDETTAWHTGINLSQKIEDTYNNKDCFYSVRI